MCYNNLHLVFQHMMYESQEFQADIYCHWNKWRSPMGPAPWVIFPKAVTGPIGDFFLSLGPVMSVSMSACLSVRLSASLPASLPVCPCSYAIHACLGTQLIGPVLLMRR
jgi:hypothetical protein